MSDNVFQISEVKFKTKNIYVDTKNFKRTN